MSNQREEWVSHAECFDLLTNEQFVAKVRYVENNLGVRNDPDWQGAVRREIDLRLLLLKRNRDTDTLCQT